MLNNILRGADPELFLRDGAGQPVTSIGLIGGSKEEPRSIGNGYALQEDNVAVEFNIPPASSKKAFVDSIHFVLDHLTEEVARLGLTIDVSPTMEFTVEQLLHPQAQHLGCDPDFNAWTGKVNPRPKAPPNLRSSGGHLHIGYSDVDTAMSKSIIKAHDLFCGVASVMFDSDTRRRDIYGKAGACRYKDYGVEYRTLSNFWLQSKDLTEMIYEQSEKAIDFINNGGKITAEWGSKIVQCINTGDKSLVREINSEFGVI
jgi:hypothetical protein